MAEKQQTCPFKEPLTDSKGFVNRLWLSWFQKVRVKEDSISQLPYYVFTNTGAVLTERHMGKVIVFENGDHDVTCVLPHIAKKDLYSWIDIYRLGHGRLTISANDLDKIERSSYGGKIYSDEELRFAANLRLMVIRENLWAIPVTGIWKTL